MTGPLLAVLTAVFFPGVILRVKSILSGRKGPGIFQPWQNIFLLMKKTSVISTTASLIFRAAPVVYMSTILCAMLLLPFPGMPSLSGFSGDFILFAGLLALGKFFFILGALDTGSSFEGMGASREALFSLLIEPAFFILFATLSFFTGQTSMQQIFGTLAGTGPYAPLIGIIGVYLLVQILMIENSRMPVDDPKTHLELTMIHEVMILDHSGFDLAMIQTGTVLKFSLFGGLIANFLIPATWSFPVQLIAFLATQTALAAMIGFMESFRARKKMDKNPQFIVTLSSIALLVFILVVLLTRNLIR